MLLWGIFLFSESFAIASTHKKLTELHNQIHQLQTTMQQEATQQKDILLSLQEVEIKLGELSQEINHLTSACASEQNKLNQLKQQRDILSAHLLKQRTALARQILAMYHLKDSQAVKVILNQQNPHNMSRYLQYYRYMNASRLELIASAQGTLALLNNNMQAILTQEEKLKIVLQKKQLQQEAEEASQQTRLKLIEILKQKNETNQQRLTILLANQKNLETIFTSVQALLPVLHFQSFEHARHHLSWPIKGTLIAPYGSLLDVGQVNTGVIIKSGEKSPVHAIYAGKVIFANWLRGFGLLVIINHGNGYMSLYARNHSLNTHAGALVQARDVIATTGKSGGFDKAGLYFEIRRNGIPQNPSIWCH